MKQIFTIENIFQNWLKAYRAKHGIEAAQVKKDGAVWPLKAAKDWTAYLKGSK